MYTNIIKLEKAMERNFNSNDNFYEIPFKLSYGNTEIEIPIFPETWNYMEDVIKALKDIAIESEMLITIKYDISYCVHTDKTFITKITYRGNEYSDEQIVDWHYGEPTDKEWEMTKYTTVMNKDRIVNKEYTKE